MIRLAKPTAALLCAALGLLFAAPAFAQQSPAADQTAPAKKKVSKTSKDAAANDKSKPGDKAKSADKTKPGDKNAAKPQLIGTYGDWNAYRTQSGKNRICYILAQPKDRAPADLKRDDGYAFISDRPAEGVRNEISFIVGFDVVNPSAEADSGKEPEKDAKKEPKKKSASAEPMASVGDQSFELLAKSENLWLKNPAMESQLVGEMRKGTKLLVRATSKKGHVSTDTYSLAGFAQALDRAQKECSGG